MFVRQDSDIFVLQQPDAFEPVTAVDQAGQSELYAAAVKLNSGPTIVVGNEKRRAGKIFVDMTGGTGGAKEAYEKERETKLKEVSQRSGSTAAYVPPPPPPPPVQRPSRPSAPKQPAGGGPEDAAKMLEELKKADKVPMLAPPKLDP